MHFTVVVFGSIPHRIRQFSLSWMKNIKMKKTSRLIYSSVSTGPLTVQKADGTIQNYSKEMMKLYFKDHGEDNFDLLFDSEEEAQHYVDEYKAAVVGEGETILAERISFAPQPQSSMVIIDQHTGYVKALVGGRGEKTASLTLNRATDTYRQPGSTFKPLAFTDLLSMIWDLLWQTLMWIRPSLMRIQTARVKNAYSGYRGTMTIRDASSIPVIPLPYSASVM